jgi:hypothetical protein
MWVPSNGILTTPLRTTFSQISLDDKGWLFLLVAVPSVEPHAQLVQSVKVMQLYMRDCVRVIDG